MPASRIPRLTKQSAKAVLHSTPTPALGHPNLSAAFRHTPSRIPSPPQGVLPSAKAGLSDSACLHQMSAQIRSSAHVNAATDEPTTSTAIPRAPLLKVTSTAIPRAPLLKVTSSQPLPRFAYPTRAARPSSGYRRASYTLASSESDSDSSSDDEPEAATEGAAALRCRSEPSLFPAMLHNPLFTAPQGSANANNGESHDHCHQCYTMKVWPLQTWLLCAACLHPLWSCGL